MRTFLFSLFLFGLFSCQNEPASPPIEPREVRLELNGTQLFCKVIGQGSPLLVIHGGPGLGHAYFLPHFEKLAQDHTLIFYDQRASGQSASDLDSAGISLDLFLKDMDALRAYFGQEKISLLGHSWGGLLAMQYALKYPDRIDRLILSSPSPASSKLRASESAKLAERLTDADKAERAAIIASPEFKAGDARAYERFFRWFFKKEFADTTLADQLRLNFPADFVAKNRVLQYLTKDFGQYDMHEDLKNIKAPTLILFGDHESTIEAGKKISEYIPDAKFVLLKNAGHFPFIEQPDAYFEAINDFLD